MSQSKDIWRKIVILAIVGGLSFWAISIATSLLPFTADYRVARWSAETVWVGSLPVWLSVSLLAFSWFVSLARFRQRIHF